jgi:RNA polymerase sigma-70 factor (ECF subfamily)
MFSEPLKSSKPSKKRKSFFSRKPTKQEALDLQFTDLYQEYHGTLFGLAMKLTRSNREWSADLVQDALTRAYSALDRFDNRNPKGWLKTILTRLFFTQYAKRKKEREKMISSDFDTLSESIADQSNQLMLKDDVYLHIIEMLENPDAQNWKESLSAHIGDQLMQALSDLPVTYRVPLLLQHIPELSYEEIAEVIDCPLGTVMSRLSRARTHVRKMLEKSIGDHKKRDRSVS